MKTKVPNGGILFFCLLLFFSCSCLAGLLRPVSLADPGFSPSTNGSGDSSSPFLAPDGRYVLYASTAGNLVLADGNLLSTLSLSRNNVYLRDRFAGTTRLVSVNHAGTGGGNGDSMPTGLSRDGRYALFESTASNLVANDTNNAPDVFVRDLVSNITFLVSCAPDGSCANAGSRSSVMTPDGLYAAFSSAATNLVLNDTNNISDVFLRNLSNGVTILASPGATGINRQSLSDAPDISNDGHLLAFFSNATNLVAGVTNAGEIYLRDVLNNTTVQVSAQGHTLLQSTTATAYNPILSADGKYVVYEIATVASTRGLLLRYQVQTGSTDLVSTNATCPMGSLENAETLDFSADGRFIAFIGNTNDSTSFTTGVFVWDGQTGTTVLASGNATNAVLSGSFCSCPRLDGAGRRVAFIGNSFGTNSFYYYACVRDLQTSTTVMASLDVNNLSVEPPIHSSLCLSSNGSSVVFCANGPNHFDNLFVRNLTNNVTELLTPGATNLLSRASDGPALLSPYSVSADGRYIAFASEAANLVTGDTNRFRDVFVRDLFLNSNTLVSVGLNGVGASGISDEPAISGDGRYVAFSSTATNLSPLDTSSLSDVYVADRQAHTMALGSVASSGLTSGNNSSYAPVLSPDGRFLLFLSKATNLAPGAYISGTENIFLRDLQTSSTVALTVGGTSNSTLTNDYGNNVSMSLDGRYIVFIGRIEGSFTTNIYLWDTKISARVFTITTTGSIVAGVSPDGTKIAWGVGSQILVFDRKIPGNISLGTMTAASRYGFSFSADSRFLAYAGAVHDVFLYDFQTHSNILVSHAFNSTTAASGASDYPMVNVDGSLVAYRSVATNLVNSPLSGRPNIFVYNRLLNTSQLVTPSLYGQTDGNRASFFPVFDAHGQTLVFSSWASDLTPFDFNQRSGIFSFGYLALDIQPLPPPASGFLISWPVNAGQSYRLQFKNDLQDTAWEDWTGTIELTDTIGRIRDLNPPVHRTYRALAY